jgi:hypothetical protein
MILHYCSSFSLCREVGMIMQSHWRTFTSFMSASIFCNFFYFSYVLGITRIIFRTVIGILFNPSQ